MRRPLVLNTRPREQASELSNLLRSAGFDVVEAPAIAIEPAWDASTLEAVRLDLARGGFDRVVLPSQNAARGLERELNASGDRVLCGAATAQILGLTTARILDRFSAATALETLRPLLSPGQRVLIPRAAEGREELVDGLRDLGIDVVTPVAYATVPAEEAAARARVGDVDVVVVCSPSAVTSIAAALTETPLLVCLGQTTANAARAEGVRVDAVATRPTMTALVEAVEFSLGARV